MTPLLQTLVDRLREELQQYGEMLALLDQQQQFLSWHGSIELEQSLSAIHTQGTLIQAARQQRETAERHVLEACGESPDASFSRLLPNLPKPYDLLVIALVQENNELLKQVGERAEQNLVLLQRSIDSMRQLLSSLAPPYVAVLPPPPLHPFTTDGPESPLYAAIL